MLLSGALGGKRLRNGSGQNVKGRIKDSKDRRICVESDRTRRTNNKAVNPHLQLDYYRVISDSVCNFAKMQADIIRKYKKPMTDLWSGECESGDVKIEGYGVKVYRSC